jgi:Flp pilus assembly protein TadD
MLRSATYCSASFLRIIVAKISFAYSPEAHELLATLGRAYLKVADEKRAIVVLRRAVALSPDSSTDHYQLARAYLEAGRHAEANAEMNRARLLASESAQGNMQALLKERDTGNATDESQ